jgi:hypothetical protein
MRGRKRSRLWPPTTRTGDVVSHVHDTAIDADAQTDAALLALVQVLARQTAREVFEQTDMDAHSDRSFDEGCE